MSYAYDAWGNFITTYHNGGASTRAAKNPFTHRGYYYDRDLSLYYLNSRYYDPVVGRFINADSYVSTGQGFVGYNMFAYCNNNPVMYRDDLGTNPYVLTAIGVGTLAFLAAVGIGTIFTSQQTGTAPSLSLPSFDDMRTRIRILGALLSQIGEKEETKEEVTTAPPTSSTVIYRYGGTNPGNLTPSQRDVDLYQTTGKGLSFSTVPKAGAAATTIEALNATGVVYAVYDGAGHVSVHPVGGTLEDWHNAGSSSVWTTAVKSVVVKWNGGN